jgi:hypothetical protein
MIEETERHCEECNATKPISAFRQKRDSRNGAIYITYDCRSCYNNSRKPKNTEYELMRSARIANERKNGINRASYILIDYKNKDKKRDMDNDLTLDFISMSINKGCLYCGETTIARLGLDRIDNSIGHLQMNVVPCCRLCNFTKKDMPHEAWLFIAPKIKEARNLGLFGDWEPSPRSRSKK